VAGHLCWPTRFVMPHVPELRPRWMIRTGLFLYDHLTRRSLLPGSRSVRLDRPPYGSGLRRELKHGFVFSDCRVDDSRLVVANALDAAQRGARVLVGVECQRARRAHGLWRAELSNGETLQARALVNAAGPWVKRVLNEDLGQSTRDSVRLVKGSHIVLPRLYDGAHAFILQNDDRRVVFMIPYEDRFTLVGTTDVDHDGDAAAVEPSAAEIDYLCRAAGRYLARPPQPADVIWSYAGVRPLYDDGSQDPSAITRDYTLRVDDVEGRAPVLSVFGGKITTYRRLAEAALEKLAPYFPGMQAAWTAREPLPGSDFVRRESAKQAIAQRYPQVPANVLQGVFRRHGTLAPQVLGDGRLGEYYGAGLTEREVAYLREREWARGAEDILWRRTKCGLRMTEAQRARVREVVGR
jgi:glycerol-3-phosphate dehydrogenase